MSVPHAHENKFAEAVCVCGLVDSHARPRGAQLDIEALSMLCNQRSSRHLLWRYIDIKKTSIEVSVGIGRMLGWARRDAVTAIQNAVIFRQRYSHTL